MSEGLGWSSKVEGFVTVVDRTMNAGWYDAGGEANPQTLIVDQGWRNTVGRVQHRCAGGIQSAHGWPLGRGWVRRGRHALRHGVSGSLEAPALAFNWPSDCAWFGAGGEAHLQALRVVPRARKPFVDGMLGRAKSSCEWSTGDTVGWCGKAQCRVSANGERDATGERSVSIAKFAGITPHNLRDSR